MRYKKRPSCIVIYSQPPVSSQRMDQILASFDKMDPKKNGRISTADIKSLYNARNHPLYQNGDSTEKELTDQVQCRKDLMNIR